MSKLDDDAESPPIIFTETAKLLESLETNEEQILTMKCLLEHKQTYYEQLLQHENSVNKSVAEKRATLSILNNRASLVNTKNSYYRDKGKEICVSCNTACQDINDIDSTFGECEEKVGDMSKILGENNAQYDKKLDELIKLLNQLTEKRKTKLNALELQEKELRKENFELKSQLMVYGNEEDLITNESDNSDLGDLENELKDLQNKLTILDEDYSNIAKEDTAQGVAKKEIEKKFHESVFAQLETKSTEINDQINLISQNVAEQKTIEQEVVSTYQTLEDYEKKLDEDLAQTAKFWEDLDRNQYGGFSKVEQQIGKIRADIIERNEKFGAVQKEKSQLLEDLGKKEDEIEVLSPIIEQLNSELKEVETILQTLKTTDDLEEQFNAMCNKLDDICKEKALIDNITLDKEDKIQKIVNQLHKEKEKGDLQILTLENSNVMELKELKKQYADVEASKIKIENEAKSSESQIKELEDAIKMHKEKTEIIARNHKDLDEIIDKGQRNLRLIDAKKDELKKKLGSLTAPPPLYLKRNEPHQDFARPKTPEPPKKVPIKKIPSPKAKRNWDSDSSMEGEELKLSECLKKKYRRRQDSGK